MLVDVVIPELGESITEGTITTWHAKVGDRVEEDQPLLEVDTDKVSVDVPSPTAGVVKELLMEEGADVPVGTVVARIEQGAEAGEAPSEDQGAAPAPEKQEKAPEAKAAPKPEAGPPAGKPAEAEAAQGGPGEAKEAGEPGPLSPAVRRLVEEHGVDPGKVAGSGPHGRVLKEDVLQFMEGGGQAGAAAPRLREVPPPQPETATGGRGERRVKMTRLRRRIAQNLKEVQNTAAILTTFNEIDMSAVMSARRRYKEAFEKRHGVRLGFMGFFVKAVIEGLKAFPAINGFIEGDEIVYHDYYDIGVAVSSDKGLVVPVVRNADRLGFAQIESTIGELAVKARKGELTLDELSGGTFSITNGGVFGSLLSTPILNPPQSGILGMHAINDRPVAVDGKVEIRPVMMVALSYDHRIVDGREAVQFLVKVKDAIEDPSRLLLEI